MASAQRIFPVSKNGQEILLSVRTPVHSELQRANMEYSRTYQIAIREGIAPRSRMMKDLRKNGVWTDADDQALTDANNKVRSLEAQLKEDKFASDADRVACQAVHKQALDDFNRDYNELNNMMRHSCDGKAEEHQRLLLASLTIEYAAINPKTGAHVNVGKAGKPFYPTLNDLLQDNGDHVERIMYEYSMFAAGLPADWDKVLLDDQAAEVAADQTAPIITTTPTVETPVVQSPETAPAKVEPVAPLTPETPAVPV